MSSSESTPGSQRPDDLLRRIDAVIDELAEQARGELAPDAFCRMLLAKAVDTMAALGAAIWLRTGRAPLALAGQVGLDEALGRWGDREDASHQALLENVLQGGRLRTIDRASDPAGVLPGAGEAVLLLCPWRSEGDTAGLVEVLQRGGVARQALAGHQRFVAVLAELVSDYYRHRGFTLLRAEGAFLRQVEEFAAAVHATCELTPTAYHIANEGRRLLDCDRLSVLVSRRRRFRLLATSGVDTVDRRSDTAIGLERLAALVAAGGDAVWYTDSTEGLAPQLERPLNEYVDQSSARLVAVLPLEPAPGPTPDEDDDSPPRSDDSPGRSDAVLVLEEFTRRDDSELRRRAEVVARHAAAALHSARQFEGLPLYWLSRGLLRLGWFARPRRMSLLLLATTGMLAAVLALAVIPADFRVQAPGRLEPEIRRHVFAPADGVIDQLMVTAPGQRFAAGDELAVLSNPQLDFQQQQVVGQWETAAKRLAAVRVERLGSQRLSREDRGRVSRQTAEEEELRTLMEGLRRQREVLALRQDQLHVRSPIDGEVLTWDVSQLLETRPVVRGQRLMTIADLDGPWVLELRIPDDRVGHVLEARRRWKRSLPVTFILATDPGLTYRGRLTRLAMATETQRTGPPAVLATVAIDPHQGRLQRRPGATVVGKISCGRRSLLYLGFHDLVDAVRRHVLF